MRRRKYLSASAALLTASIAGCSQSSGEATPTEDSTSTEPDDSTPVDTETSTSIEPDDSTPADTETPTTNNASDGTQLQYQGDTLTLDNAADQMIRGTTDLEAGTELEIALDSETASDPFVKRPETTVQDGGQFSATVDMSNNDEGSEFTVEVIHDDETLAEADGQIV